MSRTVRWSIIASSLVLPLLFLATSFRYAENTVAADAGDDAAIEKVRKAYRGGMYLSYTPVHDLSVLLDDNAKFGTLVKNPPPSEKILKALKAFLTQIEEQNLVMSKSLAVLHLDLQALEASFVLLSDKSGVATRIPWDKDEVEAIAVFFDKFLKAQLEFEKKTAGIRDGKGTLKESW